MKSRLAWVYLLAACGGTDPQAPAPPVSPPAPPPPETPAPTATVDPPVIPPCAPTGGGPYWLQEGGVVTAHLRCGTGREVPGSAFTFASLPAGATYDPATATLTWTPALDQANVWLLDVMVEKEHGSIKIGVADKFDDPANVPVKDPLTYTEEFGLPVFHIKTTPALDAALPNLKAENGSVQSNSCAPQCYPDPDSPLETTYRGHVFQATGHYRGASSLNYPKKNYTLKFPKGDRFDEPEQAGGRVKGRHEIALISTFDDNSYVRWRMAFELWNRMDPAIIRVEHYSAVVYVDGKYQGLYAVSDKIGDDMMERAGLSKDGNLYMGVTHNANFDAMVKVGTTVRARACAWEGFDKKQGLPDACTAALVFVPQAFDDLAPFMTFVSTSTDAQFSANIGKTIATRDYYDWFIHATAITAGDSYEKNALHYHDPVAAGPWRVVIWDYNDSFGQAWNTVRRGTTTSPSGIATSAGPPATNRLWFRLWADAKLGPEMRARYATALKTVIKVEDVLAAFDAFVLETAEGARRDERKWGEAYKTYYGPTSSYKRTDLTTYAVEIPYTRTWITDRWAFLKTQFP